MLEITRIDRKRYGRHLLEINVQHLLENPNCFSFRYVKVLLTDFLILSKMCQIGLQG